MFQRIGSYIQKMSWWQTLQTFSFPEKLAAFGLGIVAVGAIGFWSYVGFVINTIEGPKRGGVYTEAVFGQPTYYNPLLLRMGAEGEAEANVTALIYSGLFRADGKGGVTPDLAERYDVSEDGKEYTVYLRQDAQWHDGERVDADDVLYTFHTIQDPRFTIAATLANTWSDIRIERVDNFTVKFVLDKAFAPFVESQLRVGILPEHLWGPVEPSALTLTKLNTQPIGSGPYKMQENVTDDNGVITGTTLTRFRDYYGTEPYIDRVKFTFVSTELDALAMFQTHQVMGVSVSADDVAEVESFDREAVLHRIGIPSMYGAFFNPLKSAALAYAEVREALAMATDRQAIVDEVLNGEAETLTEPFVRGMDWQIGGDEWAIFDVEAAKALLEEKGWKAGDDGIRAREGTVLRFAIAVPEWDNIVATADLLREQWLQIGADVQVNVLSADEFRNVLSERSYNALLFGQTYFSYAPDPFAFWHSSQKEAPGLNFSQFTNKDADELLTKVREEQDAEKRMELYKEFNETIADNVPAVFLYAPYYITAQSQRVQGVDVDHVSRPSERFETIESWYVSTTRTFKSE